MKRTFIIIGYLVMGLSVPLFAETVSDSDQAVQSKIEELKHLREKDPQAFREALQKHREEVRARLGKLRQENPEKFQEVVQKRQERIKKHYKRLKEENPEQFKQAVQKRRERLENEAESLKTKHPERYESFKQGRLLRLKELKKNNPEQFEQFMQSHPRVREKFSIANLDQIKDVRDREGNRKDRLDNRFGKRQRPERLGESRTRGNWRRNTR